MSKWVDKINSPDDLKEIEEGKLPEVARDCRQRLIEVVARSGGHFGPNLGVVELTVALHYIFNSPRDKIIWDVGHQGYVHKMLTGRNDRLESIRQKGGLSGFLKRSESQHDIFNAGHASTSISAATGVAEALAGKDEDGEVLAVIGDGSLTGGMSFEGLNNAGGEESDLIVVLNDNGMAIAENVGAINEYFDRLIHLPAYEQVKNEIERILDAIPQFGKSALGLARRVERSVKNLVIPQLMFEELGFKYFGPVDGHDTGKLLREFERIKQYDGPRFVHVITEKGHGYKPAEEDTYASHATVPFDIETGQPVEEQEDPAAKWSQRVGQTLSKIGDGDEDLITITAAMKKGTGTAIFEKNHPERFYDVGIAEQHAVTFAGGLAAEGKKPAVCIYSTFLQRAYDQVFHDVCLMELPVKFFLDRAGIVGGDGETHQGIFDLSYLRPLPNIVVGAPGSSRELEHFINTAVNYNEGPIAVRYPRARVTEAESLETDDLDRLEIGRGKKIREGKDVALVALGPMVQRAQKAAMLLNERGVDATVINARWAKPLDEELILQAAEQTGAVVTVEEGILDGGFGSAVLELLNGNNKYLPVERMGIPEGIVSHGQREEYLEEFDLTGQGIARRARGLVEGSEV
ncbi:MAG: 1-deoxy-D-xylulose-5-phosphate synthase [bacterium]